MSHELPNSHPANDPSRILRRSATLDEILLFADTTKTGVRVTIATETTGGDVIMTGGG